MALYSLRASYTPLGWAALLKTPQHRLEAITPVVEKLGGRIVSGWFSFGEFDLLVICDLPDSTSAAALSMAITAGGAVRAVETVPLLSFEDGLDAMRRARQAEYTPPTSEIPYFGVYRGGA